MLCVAQRHLAEAGRLAGAADALRNLVGTPAASRSRSAFVGDFSSVRSQQDRSVFGAAWAEGQGLSSEQAMDYALALPDCVCGPAGNERVSYRFRHRSYPPDLTAREVEVLRWLAQGLTYAQIADKLIITRRTVNGHVTSIYGKLGVNGRAAATRSAMEYHLVYHGELAHSPAFISPFSTYRYTKQVHVPMRRFSRSRYAARRQKMHSNLIAIEEEVKLSQVIRSAPQRHAVHTMTVRSGISGYQYSTSRCSIAADAIGLFALLGPSPATAAEVAGGLYLKPAQRRGHVGDSHCARLLGAVSRTISPDRTDAAPTCCLPALTTTAACCKCIAALAITGELVERVLRQGKPFRDAQPDDLSPKLGIR